MRRPWWDFNCAIQWTVLPVHVLSCGNEQQHVLEFACDQLRAQVDRLRRKCRRGERGKRAHLFPTRLLPVLMTTNASFCKTTTAPWWQTQSVCVWIRKSSWERWDEMCPSIEKKDECVLNDLNHLHGGGQASKVQFEATEASQEKHTINSRQVHLSRLNECSFKSGHAPSTRTEDCTSEKVLSAITKWKMVSQTVFTQSSYYEINLWI